MCATLSGSLPGNKDPKSVVDGSRAPINPRLGKSMTTTKPSVPFLIGAGGITRDLQRFVNSKKTDKDQTKNGSDYTGL